jgi:hypothetical protein
MSKTILASMLALALVFAYPAAQSVAEETVGNGWDQTYGEISEESILVGSSWDQTSGGNSLVGAAVKSPEGEFLGIVNDLVTDSDGRVSFAIVNFGNYQDYGDGGRFVAVPFGALSCYGPDCFLNSSYEQLASSPVFLSKDELNDWQMAGDVYRYFGQQPYWTDDNAIGHDAGHPDWMNEDDAEPDTGFHYRMDEESPGLDMGGVEY